MKIKVRTFFIAIIFALIYVSGHALQNPFEIRSASDETSTEQQNTTVQNGSESSAITANPLNPFDKTSGEIKGKKPSKVVSHRERFVNEEQVNLGTVPKAIILLGSLFSLFMIRSLNQKSVQNILESVMNNAKLVSFKNSFNGPLTLQLALFYVFFFFNMAYFFYIAFDKLGWSAPYTGFTLFGFLMLGVFLVYLVKYLVLYLLEFGLEIRRAVSTHLFSISVHNIFLGFLLFVVNVFFPFADGGFSTALFYIGVSIIAIIYLFRQVKSLSFLSEMRQFNMFHFFIYLCACEISPLIVASKFIIG